MEEGHNITCIFDVDDIKKGEVSLTLKEIAAALNERGYNPVNQLVGYLISGDPGFISSYKDARKKIVALDRSDIVAILLHDYLNKK